MTTTELMSDTISKLYHLKDGELKHANELISALVKEEGKPKERVGGKYKGQFVLKDNFDDPLPLRFSRDSPD